ncbi:MAG: glutathione S-transferase [Gammaproteobacteria bacterium]
MRLVGMLDSPYVRRVAITCDCLGVAFVHEPLSVFTTFEAFQRINPVVKAPTLVCDDGEAMMDSSLILQFVEATCSHGRTLWPADARERQHDFRAVSLALAACEKSVQIVYECNLRPPEARYAPWLTRVQGQMRAGFAALEHEVAARPHAFAGASHASITAAVVWQFVQSQPAASVHVAGHPALRALSARMEQLPVFLKYPPAGPGVPAAD